MEAANLVLEDSATAEKVLEFLRPFVIDEEKVKKIKTVFEEELEAGLKNGLKGSSLQMENTYVPEMTNGQEEGNYLALDLGGTNFRVMLLSMQKGRIEKEEVEYYSVAEATRLGPGEDLFDFLASCIADFVSKKLPQDYPPMPLGFTFSFPMEQRGLDVGILVAWTKSFNASGVVGQDAVKMLNDAIKRQGNLRVNVVAILNDATGTLVKGSYDDKRTGIGLILGTGCNGAYLEKANKVINWVGDRHDAKEVIIDPEFGAFGDNGCIDFIKTDVDRQLDDQSLLPKSFTFEKYFAGKYLGEIARLIFVHLHSNNLFMPNHENFNVLNKKDAFSAATLSKIMTENSDVSSILESDLSIKNVSEDDIKIMKLVCDILSERCGVLVAVPMSVFIERMQGKDHVSIAITGSLYKYHPKVKNLLEKHIAKLVPDRSFDTFLSDDGSGKGAGLVAAIAARLAQN